MEYIFLFFHKTSRPELLPCHLKEADHQQKEKINTNSVEKRHPKQHTHRNTVTSHWTLSHHKNIERKIKIKIIAFINFTTFKNRTTCTYSHIHCIHFFSFLLFIPFHFNLHP